MTVRVAVVATGGTIQNTPEKRVDFASVWQRVGEYAGSPVIDAELDVHDIICQGSEAFGPSEWRQIAATVQATCDEPSTDAVVVAHGTFTAEETAYLLHLVVDTTKPVIVVVSQRKHATVGNDGDKNLLDAVRVAATTAAAGHGVVLVANEEIHCAREVTKENQRPGAFVSPPTGPLGTVESDRVSFYRTPLRQHTHRSALRRIDLTALPRVDIVTGYAGADPSGIEAAIEAGTGGIVLSGFAYSGRGTDSQMDALEAAQRRGVAVVLASRGRGGRIPDPGDSPFVRADNLTAQKARVLAILGLAAAGPATLQELYDSH